MREIEINALQEGQRLDRFLRKYLKEASASFLYKMLRKKNITLNGHKADGSEKLKCGDCIRIYFSDETFEKFRGSLQSKDDDRPSSVKWPVLPLDIIYEDENIILVNKPAGMLTQKADINDISLNEYLIGYLLRSGALSESELSTFRPSVCNRLDRNTSGIVAAGKTLKGLQELSAVFKDRSIRKYYRSIVIGRLEKEETREGFLIKDEKTNKVRIISEKLPGAQPVKTFYRPLAWSQDGAGHDLTYLEIELLTGRSHQIRAHLSSLGHPLAGDPKYGNFERNDYFRREYKLSRQLLHAERIEFPKGSQVLEPLSGRTFHADLPEDFQRILKGEGIIYPENRNEQ